MVPPPSRRGVLLGLSAASIAIRAPPPSLLSPFPAAAEAASLPLVPPGVLFPGCRLSPAPSAVIKGCWQLSGRHKGDAESDRTSPKLASEDFQPFVDAGISTFDTGPESVGYGPSEKVIGDYLAASGAKAQVYTKLGFMGPEQASPSRDFVSKAVSKSLSRLGVEKIDNLQMYWNSVKIDGYAYAAQLAMEEVAGGRVRNLGVTNFNVACMEKIAARGVELASSQVQYSLLDRRADNGMAEYCRTNGIALLPYGVLGGGFLTDQFLGVPEAAVKLDRDSYLKYMPVVKEAGGWDWLQRLLAVLRGVADKHGVTIANVATRWVLQKEVVPAVIVGARNARHVGDHRLLFTFKLDGADLSAINAVLEEGQRPRGDCYDWERHIGPF